MATFARKVEENQWWAQDEQLRVPQPAQSLHVPVTERAWPSPLRLKAAKVEKTREVCVLAQLWQAIGSSAWLMRRSNSNLV